MSIRTWSTHRASAAVVAAALASGSLTIAAKDAIPSRPDGATVRHVIDRISFGAKPGDVDRVTRMGIAAYIDEQLNPERIADGAIEARLAAFTTLNLSTRALADEYFLPALMLRRDEQVKQQVADAKTARSDARAGQGRNASPDEGMMRPPAPQPANPDAALPPEVRAARQAAQTVVNELMQARMLRATLSDRQLEEVLTDFWFNHFNVSVTKGQVRQYLTSYERDTIRPHVLGRFRDLLGAVAHSPAMLVYLDNWQSAAPNASGIPDQIQQRLNDSRLRPEQRQRVMERLEQMRAQARRPARGLNENYAREIMELHTLGVDGGYTQKDVTELARILTGWTIDRPQMGGDFVFRPEMHDNGTKTFLGVTFKGDGQREGERALDLLAEHPATARHIAYQLAQRFVADEPPAELVDRAAKTFTATKGDVRDVVRTIITSPEFFSDDVRRVKVKTPLEFVVSSVRATGAAVTSAQPLVAALRNLGMPLYSCEPPTGYSMTADAWVNTGSLLNRMNFAVDLVSGGRILPQQTAGRGGAPPAGRLNAAGAQAGRGRGRGAAAPAARGPITIDLQTLAPDASESSQDTVIDTLLGGQASDATRRTLARADNPRTLVALTLGSPEFQRR